MGGRGTYSASKVLAGGVSSTNMKGIMLVGDPENRRDIINMFDEIGISSLVGTDVFNTAVMGAFGIQLHNLEKKYGAISDSTSVSIQGVEGGDFKGAVAYIPADPTFQTLALNATYLGNIGKLNSDLKYEQKIGFKTQTDGTILNQARYTVTHEYGHMLENVLYQKAKQSGYTGTQNQFNAKVKQEIHSGAVKYGVSAISDGSPSGYGSTNAAEFFAESFASANLGKPNAYGKSMQDWLKKQGF